MKTKKFKTIPKFNNEDEERDFWDRADSSEYFDYSRMVRAKFPNLKLSTETISLRLTKGMLDDLKIAANRRDVPYQSLIKIYLDQALRSELYK
jgi:predicted DNA binding CopG/RHH family protein